jgi:hypothetical protein
VKSLFLFIVAAFYVWTDETGQLNWATSTKPIPSGKSYVVQETPPNAAGYLDAATMALAKEYRDVLAVWGCNETNRIEVNAAIIITNPTNSPSQKIDAQADLLGKRILLREAGYSFDGTSNKVTGTFTMP